MRNRLLIAIGVFVSLTLLWLAVRGTDVASIRNAFVSATWIWAAPFLGALLTFYWLKAARWAYLLSPASSVRAKDLFPSVMIGYAGTAILPMQLGELIRAYIAGKKHTLPYSLVLSSIGMERIFDLLTILALLAITFSLGQETPEALITAGYIVAIVTLIGLVMAILIVTQPKKTTSLVLFMTAWLPEKIRNGLVGIVESAASGLNSIKDFRLVLRIAANSVLQWTLMGFCIGCSLIALGINIPVAGVALVLIATIIGITVPTGPGYVGNIQFAFVISLQPFDVDPATAVAASFFYHVLAYVTVILVGTFFVRRESYNVFALNRDAKESANL